MCNKIHLCAFNAQNMDDLCWYMYLHSCIWKMYSTDIRLGNMPSEKWLCAPSLKKWFEQALKNILPALMAEKVPSLIEINRNINIHTVLVINWKSKLYWNSWYFDALKWRMLCVCLLAVVTADIGPVLVYMYLVLDCQPHSCTGRSAEGGHKSVLS